MATLYRVLTGPDDSAFCHRVSQAINGGWSLYGAPSISFDPVAGRMICAQAITKEVPGLDYAPELTLSDF